MNRPAFQVNPIGTCILHYGAVGVKETYVYTCLHPIQATKNIHQIRWQSGQSVYMQLPIEKSWLCLLCTSRTETDLSSACSAEISRQIPCWASGSKAKSAPCERTPSLTQGNIQPLHWNHWFHTESKGPPSAAAGREHGFLLRVCLL